MADTTNLDITVKTMPDMYDFYISGEIEESTLERFRKEILEKTTEVDTVIKEQSRIAALMGLNPENCEFLVPNFNIHINTYGGSVYPGLGICDIIEDLAKNFNVNIFCSGYIMSMGIPIILSGTKRFAYKNTTFMIHEVSSINCGKLTQMKDDIKETERLNTILKNMIVSKSKITEKEIDSWYEKQKDIFMSAEEALSYGLIDEIL